MIKQKQRLIILSDMWGKAKWTDDYISRLNQDFTIAFYDINSFTSENKTFKNEKERHDYFIKEGIQNVVNQLIKKEESLVYVLAFSMGGTIAWKAALVGLPIQFLLAVSATRLRYETTCPAGIIQLIYGADDVYTPSQNWLKQFPSIQTQFIAGEGHELYKKPLFVEAICQQLITALS